MNKSHPAILVQNREFSLIIEGAVVRTAVTFIISWQFIESYCKIRAVEVRKMMEWDYRQGDLVPDSVEFLRCLDCGSVLGSDGPCIAISIDRKATSYPVCNGIFWKYYEPTKKRNYN